MCYHCATNPSIHHYRRCVAAMSSPLSHHGVAFAVASSQFCCCCRSVTFVLVAVSSLPSRCRLRHRIVMVSSSQLCHCGAFAVALSPFHCRHCGVAFVIALSRFHHHHHGVTFASVMVSSSPSWCRLRIGHGFIVTIMVLLSLSHCHGFIVVMVLPSSSHCRGVIVTVSLSPLRCRLQLLKFSAKCDIMSSTKT